MTQHALYDALKRIKPLRSAVQRLRAVLCWLRVEVWVLVGTERRSGEPLEALIAGQLQTKNYLAELLFQPSYSEIHRRMWRWSVLRKATTRRSSHAMAFVDTDVRHSRQSEDVHVFWLRGWVRTELELARAVERIQRSDGIKSDVRKIQENGLSCDTTCDPIELELFYWDLYVPYARRGYGDKAIYMDYEQMWSGLKNPVLLRIKKDGQTVAGMVILQPENAVPHWWLLGIRNGDRNLVKQGVLAALYLFGIRYLEERGYARALLGGVRPFLTDGVLQYKRKWGARLIAGDDGDPHWFLVAITQPTRAVREFLKACPLIGEDEEGLVGSVFVDDVSSDDNERVRRQQVELSALGVERARVVALMAIGACDDSRQQEGKRAASPAVSAGPPDVKPDIVSLTKSVPSVRN